MSSDTMTIPRLALEHEAMTVYNRHRCKWTQPDWDRLPLTTPSG